MTRPLLFQPQSGVSPWWQPEVSLGRNSQWWSDPLSRVQRKRALGTEDLISSHCSINFYFYPWRSMLMEIVPSTEPKVHFLHLNQNYTQEQSCQSPVDWWKCHAQGWTQQPMNTEHVELNQTSQDPSRSCRLQRLWSKCHWKGISMPPILWPTEGVAQLSLQCSWGKLPLLTLKLGILVHGCWQQWNHSVSTPSFQPTLVCFVPFYTTESCIHLFLGQHRIPFHRIPFPWNFHEIPWTFHFHSNSISISIPWPLNLVVCDWPSVASYDQLR